MRVAALISGGKDSIYATYTALELGWDVKYLIAMFPAREDSYMFHRPNVWVTELQAESMGISLIKQRTKGEKEKEIDDLRKAIEPIRKKIDGIVSGAVASEYQKERIDMLCEELELRSFAPLWHKNPEYLWNNLIHAGFEIMMTSVSAEGLGKEWLGRIIGKKELEKLKSTCSRFGIHLGGEGGEFETLVLDAPFFKKKLVVRDSEKVWDAETKSGELIVKKAALIEKR